MKAYEDFESRPPVVRGEVRSTDEKFKALELSSECFERGGESVTHKKLKANSYAVRKFTPSVRQGKTWREMSGRPFTPSGSTKRTHGKKVRQDGTVVCNKIITFNAKYASLGDKR